MVANESIIEDMADDTDDLEEIDFAEGNLPWCIGFIALKSDHTAANHSHTKSKRVLLTKITSK